MEYNVEDMDWFDRLESTVTHLLARARDPKTQTDIMAAFQVARAESQTEQQGQVKSLAISNIRPQDIMDTFGLTYDTRPDRVWQLHDGEQRHVTESLNVMLNEYETALGDADETAMNIRHRLDAIFHSALASSRRENYGATNRGPMQWQYDRLIEFPWVYRGKPNLLSGRADYVLSCSSLNWIESNCVVIRAQRQGMNGEHQALSLVAMIHQARKKAGKNDIAIYGIATDSYAWCFVRLNHDGKVSTRRLSWPEGQYAEIITNIHKIMFAAELNRRPRQIQVQPRQPQAQARSINAMGKQHATEQQYRSHLSLGNH